MAMPMDVCVCVPVGRGEGGGERARARERDGESEREIERAREKEPCAGDGRGGEGVNDAPARGTIELKHLFEAIVVVVDEVELDAVVNVGDLRDVKTLLLARIEVAAQLLPTRCHQPKAVDTARKMTPLRAFLPRGLHFRRRGSRRAGRRRGRAVAAATAAPSDAGATLASLRRLKRATKR